jgi:hypothetical protein
MNHESYLDMSGRRNLRRVGHDFFFKRALVVKNAHIPCLYICMLYPLQEFFSTLLSLCSYNIGQVLHPSHRQFVTFRLYSGVITGSNLETDLCMLGFMWD